MDTSHLHLIYEAHSLVERSALGGNSTNTDRPPAYKAVGLTLAVASGLLIGTSFVLKKTGLLRANEKYNEEAGEGYGYLRNFYWWAGMTLMILGEVCNFVAYAFVDAILVTPLGALSVVVTTILSAIFLKERLSFVGKIGCFNCIIGSIVIVMNAPEQSTVADIQEMRDYVAHPGFLAYASAVIVGCLFMIFWVGPRYGKKSMLVYLTICSLIGGLSVVATQGLGSAIVAQAGGKAQFNQWFLYVLLVFVVATLLTEIIYLNKALNLFNAALVTPTYYVIFTTATIVTSAILFRGFHGTPISIATIMMGFLQICSGVVLLQLSKSAKDVPDAAIFKGDLDQIREVAEQEQPETEPKADAIRGTAAIIRRISTSRAKMEHNEFKRLHQEKRLDHLEPVRENEVVEWDGLRRRKTIVGDPGIKSPIVRRKTIHPPLGMSSFPVEDETEGEGDERERAATHGGILETIRYRASSVLHPFSPRLNERDNPQSPTNPVALTDIHVHPSKSDLSTAPYSLDGSAGQEHVYGLPPGLRKPDFSDKAMPSPKSKPLPDHPAPSPAPLSPLSQPHTGARRQFSFTNFLGRRPHSPANVGPHDNLQPPPSRSGLGSRGSSYSHDRKAMKNATEEERLGLVKGDSHHALHESSPERLTHALHPIPSRSRSRSSSLGSVAEDDGQEYELQSYASRAASHTHTQPRGHRDVHYARTRSTSDSDGDDGWQITTPPPNESTASSRYPVQHYPQQQIPSQSHPSSRKRPSPPLIYRSQAIPQYDMSTTHNMAGPTLAEAVPYQAQGSHLRTTLYDQTVATQTIPPVPMGSNLSQNLSMNQPHTTIMSQELQDPVRGRNPSRDQRGQGTEISSDIRREESPESLKEVDINLDSTSAAESKKRYETQSARERDERRKRMSSGWQTSSTNAQGGGGSNPGANSGKSGRII